jgi:HSP90 family molecular chaperone
VWNQKYYVVDDKLKDYVMGSAHKKWKDFKANLKERIYEDERTDEELYSLLKKDTRVTPTDSQWLVKFWRSEEAKVPF